MLVTYVSAAILIQEMGARAIVDASTVQVLQSTLDVPTMLVLVIYAGLTIRLELFKSKYKVPIRRRPLIDRALLVLGVAIIAGFALIKYW